MLLTSLYRMVHCLVGNNSEKLVENSYNKRDILIFDWLYRGFWRIFRIKKGNQATSSDGTDTFFSNHLFGKADQDVVVEAERLTEICKRNGASAFQQDKSFCCNVC